MGQPAARVTDKVMQTPHCHAPIHPPAPVPTPLPHPPLPLPIVSGSPNVMVGGLPAARQGDPTAPCQLPSCVPGGPGFIAGGSGANRRRGSHLQGWYHPAELSRGRPWMGTASGESCANSDTVILQSPRLRMPPVLPR